VPNEGDGSIRSATWGQNPPFPIPFLPPDLLSATDPVISVSELVEGSSTETSTAVNSLNGTVSSVAGEVKGFQFVLSKQGLPGTYEQRVYSFDPDYLSLNGAFSSSLQLVPDWQDPVSGEIRNHLQVLAFGMRERAAKKGPGQLARTEFVYDYTFVPPTPGQSAPSVTFPETIPALNSSGTAYLPLVGTGAAAVGEPLRLRGLGADNGGQPQGSYWWSTCNTEADASNPTQALCRDCQMGEMAPNDLDAVGQFPANPWRFMEIVPQNACAQTNADGTCPSADVAVIKASQQSADGGLPLFTAAAMTLQQSFQDGPFTVNSPATVSQGPFVAVSTGPANGAEVAPGTSVDLAAIVSQNGVLLNRTIALFNGRLAGSLGYAEDAVTLQWTLDGAAQAGNRICLGGESVTGHRTIDLFEFREVSGGQLLVGVSSTTDLRECSVVQGEAPAVLLHKYDRSFYEVPPAGTGQHYYRSIEASMLGREAAVGSSDLRFEVHCGSAGACPQSFEFCAATGNFLWEPDPPAEVANGDWACVGAASGTRASVYRLDYTRGANPEEAPAVNVRTYTSLLECQLGVGGNAATGSTGAP
jgi:hypothetical protein